MGLEPELGQLTHYALFWSVTKPTRRPKTTIARRIGPTELASPPWATPFRNERPDDPQGPRRVPQVLSQSHGNMTLSLSRLLF